jgi:tetratricopeptide (TPR) repeat protein
MNHMIFPAVLGLLVACNGGKDNTVEGVPDIVAAESGSAAADAVTADGVVGEGSAEAAPAFIELTPEMIEARVNEAAAWLTTGQTDQASSALDALKELSVEAPDLAEIPYNMGIAYEILGNENEARKRYLRATDIDPSLGEAWLNLGALAERDNDLNRALQAYRAGLRNAPDNPELIVGVIGVLRKLGQHDDAISEARSALAKNANNVNAYNNLGLVYIEQGNLDLAQFIYQKALTDIVGAEQNALIHANLGQVFLLQDKTGNARIEFEKALELQPDLVAAKMFLAQLHMDNRNWVETASVLEEALLIEPENPAIHVNLGISYRGLGQLERAQSAYEKALELEPANPDPYLNLAILFSDHMQAYDAALQALETYQTQGGTRAELAEQWDSEIRKEQKKYERAQERKKRREESKQREEIARQAAEREAAEEAARLAEEESARLAEEEAARLAAEREAASPPQDGAEGSGVDGAVPNSMAPAVGEPAGGESSPWESGSAEPAPAVAEPAVAEPAVAEPAVAEPAAAEPAADESAPWATTPVEAAPAEAPEAEAEPAAPEAVDPAGSDIEPAESGSESAPQGSPWGMEGAQSASVDEILQAAESGGILGAGALCSALGSCSSMSLECGNSGVCQEAGTPGAFALGMGCSMDSDCAFGLACISQTCNEPPSAAPAPEMPSDTTTPEESTGSDDNPWGQQP